MFVKIIRWLFYAPAAVVSYILVSIVSMYILPYIIRFILIIFGYDATPHPYLFDLEKKIEDIRYSVSQYIELTLLMLITFFISGIAAGGVGYWICPSKNTKVISSPIIILLLPIVYNFINKTWDSEQIYRSILCVISIGASLIAIFLGCNSEQEKY